MSYGAQLYREFRPFTHEMLDELALVKRARIIKPPLPDMAKDTMIWHAVSVSFTDDGDAYEHIDDRRLTVNFHESIERRALLRTMEQVSAVAGEDFPLWQSTSCLGKSDEEDRVHCIYVSRRHYAILQAVGFSLHFEMSKASMRREQTFKTVPLHPVFMRMLLMTMRDNDAVADKWMVYGVARVLCSWVARRFFNKAVNVHGMMHDVTRTFFGDHYRRLPDVLTVIYRHLRESSTIFHTFFEGKLLGYDLMYTFFAPKQITRVHHRLIVETKYMAARYYNDIDFLKAHYEYIIMVKRLEKCTSKGEHIDQNFIFVPDDVDRRWKVDMGILQEGAFKLACDKRTHPDVGVALMLSLIASSRDDGRIVQYLEQVNTPNRLDKYVRDITRMKMRGLPPSEWQDVRRRVIYDLVYTDVYDKEINGPIQKFRITLKVVKKLEHRLGTHAVGGAADYLALVREEDTLYKGAERPRKTNALLLPLIHFLTNIDNYYTRFEEKGDPQFEVHDTCTSSDYLLPLTNDGKYLDRVFFHL